MKALLVGGSPEVIKPYILADLAAQADVIVAVDKGVDACLAAHIEPNYAVGDFDSISDESKRSMEAFKKCQVKRYPKDKDDTDLTLGLQVIDELGVTSIVATSLSGGRLDHQLGVLGTLAEYASRYEIQVRENTFHYTVLHAQHVSQLKVETLAQVGDTLSCVALRAGTCVSETGMKWSVDQLDLGEISDRGISNIVLSKDALITCHSGVLAVFAYPQAFIEDGQ